MKHWWYTATKILIQSILDKFDTIEFIYEIEFILALFGRGEAMEKD